MDYINEPLSDYDLDKLLDEYDRRTANIQTYKDIVKHNNVEKLFNNKNYCIIFVENKGEKIGHWVIVFKNKNNKNEVFWFDSYAQKMEELLPKLPNILFQKFNKIIGNKTPFQSYNTSTCGRWVLFVYCLAEIIDNFKMTDIKKIINSLKKPHQTNDDLICELVNKDL